ncbi:hypothetical protein DFH09DRAFT_1135754 [Mycena vulgaris]|nr:hypothetical protein DFH09DRAFT_1135754 [Mycena vulgaris]
MFQEILEHSDLGSDILNAENPNPRAEALYAEYLQSREEPYDLAELQANPDLEAPEPVSFEMFQQILEHSNFSSDILNVEDTPTPPPPHPAFDSYGAMLTALEEMETSDPNYSETLQNMEDDIAEYLEPKIRDPVFEGRIHALEVERSPAPEVAWRVAQLVLSTTDKWDLERVEDRLANYNGPLSQLNVFVEWYLEHPAEIELAEQRSKPKVPSSEELSKLSEESPEELPEVVEAEVVEQSTYDNNSYYYQDTPVDELARHLRNRDVQHAIKSRMDRLDREELFRLLDSIVTPVLNEDMTIFNAIAAIFSKYEDVHLVFETEPRLPRIRRLDVFKRLRPEPEDEEELLAQQQGDEEIKSLVAETKHQHEHEPAEAEKAARRQPWPDLMTRDPLMDSREVLELPPTKEIPFHNRVIIRNHHSIFTEALEADGFDFKNPNYEPTKSDEVEQVSDQAETGVDMSDTDNLILFEVISTMARLQTSKGNKDRHVKVIIVGDGNGMVGLGFGKHKDISIAYNKAIADGRRNMDWVERFEDRTIWTEVQTKFGATRVILRPRPVGFGLRCNPYVHRLLKAAGIKDVSAKVWGSRNKVGVLKATLRLLHAGHAPLGMGDGVGGPGRKMHKGTGLRNKSQIERARGRRIIDLRV